MKNCILIVSLLLTACSPLAFSPSTFLRNATTPQGTVTGVLAAVTERGGDLFATLAEVTESAQGGNIACELTEWKLGPVGNIRGEIHSQVSFRVKPGPGGLVVEVENNGEMPKAWRSAVLAALLQHERAKSTKDQDQ